MIVLVMGVSGSGKTTIGEALAERLGWPYLDADDFHPRANVEKMKAGIPLNDADRQPWLDAINETLRKADEEDESLVLGCSALKQAYRDTLAHGVRDFRTVYLKGSYELIRSRVEKRHHRYMPASLLKSQFETLEEPRDALVADVSGKPGETLAKIEAGLKSR
jgi:gluconokinase